MNRKGFFTHTGPDRTSAAGPAGSAPAPMPTVMPALMPMAMLASAGLGCLALAGPAAAQNSDAPADEIIVSATRMEMPAWKVGSSFSIVTADEIEESQAILVEDVLRRQVGLSVARNGGPGGVTSIFLRGANSGRTVVMIDGIEVNDPAASDNLFNFAALPAENIERIEIVRGPQSVLYGSKAMGGVINIITREGEDAFGVNGSIEYGSFESIRGTLGFSGRTGAVDYALSGSAYDTEGISAADAANGNTEKDGLSDYAGSARIGVQIAPNARLESTIRYTAHEAEFDSAFGTPADGPQHEESEHLVTGGKLTLDWLGGRLETVARAGYSRLDRDSFDPSGTFRALGERAEFSLQANGRINEDNILILGAEHEEEEMDTVFESPFGDFPTAGQTNIDSLFAQYQTTVLRGESGDGGLTLNAGVRFDDHSTFGDETTLRFTGAWRLAGTGTIFRASYSEGFEAPSLFSLFDPFSGNPDLQAEKSDGFDIGVEQSFAEGRGRFQATWFHIDFDNLIDFDFSTFRFANIARARSKGIEVVLDYEISDAWKLAGNYTYNDAEDRSGTPPTPLLRRADHAATARVQYAYKKRASGSLEARYAGERTDVGGAVVDDYIVVELRGRVRLTDRVELFGRIENLFDAQYQEVAGFGTPGLSAYAGLRAHY